ncbi:MAG: FAD-dependent monooxygenase [Pseudomonadota bacterium]
MTDRDPKTAIVIGGSLGGLFAGSLLREAGWNVEVFERSAHDLDGRGGGVVLQPEVEEVFARLRLPRPAGVASTSRIVYRPDGSIQDRRAAYQTQTSWSAIYRAIRDAYAASGGGYHRGKALTAITQEDDRVTATFGDGTTATGDLLVGADGNGSTVRGLLWDEEPSYAGYFAWRGLVPEPAMPLPSKDLSGAFGFSNNRESHILGYLVPGADGSIQPGERLYNWVWYRAADPATMADVMTDRTGRARGFSIPEGALRDDWAARMKADAAELLPAPFEAIVRATDRPFAQAIRDLTVETMVKGRVVLIGDAAFVPRPHTAASTSKAAANAIDLAVALAREPDDIGQALEEWNLGGLWLGSRLWEQGTSMGDYLMFKRAAPGAQVG